MTEASQTPVEETEGAGSADVAIAESSPSSPPLGVHLAEFPVMQSASAVESELPLGRFFDVTLNVSVELGRTVMPIGDLLKLGVGAVVELDRDVTDPVDVIVQGVRLARGEIVIVDNQYAVRITEVESHRMQRVGANAGKPADSTDTHSPAKA